MQMRTDLALELRESAGDAPGVECEEYEEKGAKVTVIRVTSEEGSRRLQKPRGRYVTVELPPFSDHVDDEREQLPILVREMRRFLPEQGTALVVGLGNDEITPDAVGPLAARQILATRHLTGEFARAAGLDKLRGVAALAPGVLGQTGIEVTELLKGLVEELHPAVVIAVDALASRSLARLGCTIQFADTGISPGAGVGNRRARIGEETLGVPVIAVGVPTVVDAATLAAELVSPDDEADAATLRKMVEPRGAQMIVTPREVDLLVRRAAQTLALAINCALQESLTPEEIAMLQA